MPEGDKFPTKELIPAKTILFVGGEELRQAVLLSLRTSGYDLIIASRGEEALQLSLGYHGPIQMLVANVELPDMTGVELARRLAAQRPNVNVFLLTSLQAGTLVLDHGWQLLPAPFESDMLRSRLRDLLKEPLSLRKDPSPLEAIPGWHETLTEREIQVLKLIAAGNSTKQVAAILGIAFKTTVGHRARLMKKLGIHDTASLVRYAIRAGLSDA